MTDRKARRQLARWARLGEGAYDDARDRTQLDEAIRVAISAPYQVFDQAGTLIGNGTVGGKALGLPPGTYRVVVLSEPPVTYEGIVLESDGHVTLTLPSTTESNPPGPPAPGASPVPVTSSRPPGVTATADLSVAPDLPRRDSRLDLASPSRGM